MKLNLTLLIMLFICVSAQATDVRTKYNFNPGWKLHVGDVQNAQAVNHPDKDWKEVNLPRAYNEDEAFKVYISNMSDTVMWYRKHFRLPKESKGRKVFVEFEGVRQGADFYLNGKHIGLHENGVMAVGFDLTPYINYNGNNVIAIRIDNNWKYRERATDTSFQWNNTNFNVNYGGIPKNVWLHVTGKLYQTLPLYSNLQTTGVYIYAKDISVKSRKAIIHAESEVRNEQKRPVKLRYEVALYDRDGTPITTFSGNEVTLQPNETATLHASAPVDNLHFWSWGYGYLYRVATRLVVDDRIADEVVTTTGFRKTRFGEGKIWLNDRVIQTKGFAQRTSNEWPGVGMSVPPWMSDYSNHLIVQGNGNLVRWMHVTPWKQDVESCDRVGLMQAMPAGDAEKDVEGRQWQQRVELMRDAIIYSRNNPSIIFYESGNESISREHLLEMKAIRDKYDPHGGRAIGSREMLDIRESEWGGEMLYINKSKHHPMWATEYSRDEGLRKYWDEYSYPYHKEGDGPLYRNQDASAYNHNQDQLAIEHIRRWYDYWRERPGTGRRVSSGGAKIIFSDTQTHSRGAENYRRSGVVDALRIPKDSYFVHQTMWDGWVDTENHRTYIVGHWNYEPGTVKPVYVASTGNKVELFINGTSQGFGKRDYHFLHTFDSITWQTGTLLAVSYDEAGKELSRYTLSTAGAPRHIRCTVIQNPQGWQADGADVAIVQVEVTDENGRRCPLANDMISFTLEGPAEWRGGIAQGPDNYVLAKSLPVECGINRVIIRSTNQPGTVTLAATVPGLTSARLILETKPVEVKHGLSASIPGSALEGKLTRGETPLTPSYITTKIDVPVLSVKAGANQTQAANSYDDNELSEWKNDGRLNTAWITYQLERVAEIDDICIKLTGWRMRSYPLEIFAGDELIWSGDTEKSLGYVHLNVKPVRTDKITIRLKGASTDSDDFGQITELAAPVANELDLFKAKDGDKTRNELRIVEVEFLETLWK